MAEYQAKLSSSLVFEITNDGQLIGKIFYLGWFKFNATIELANKSTYQVEPKGFWGTTIELKEGEKVLLEFEMNWNGEIVVQSHFQELTKGYLFKHRGVFKESFVLISQEGIELLILKPHLKWSKMNYEYQITTSDYFDTLFDKDILLLSSLHFANYYMAMMMSYM